MLKSLVRSLIVFRKYRGRLVVSQGELQLEVDTGRGRQMRGMAEYFTEDLQRTKSLLGAVGVPVLLIHTAADPAEQIRQQLGHVPRAGR